MKRTNIVVWLFLLASLFSLAAGVIPLLGDRPVNLTFIILGGVWLLIAIASAAKPRRSATSETEAERAQPM